MKRCKTCDKIIPEIGLFTCQDSSCIDQGPVFCKDCVVAEGTGILTTVNCKPCHERQQKRKKRLERAMKNPRRKKSSEQNELQALRKHFKVSQEVMAAYVGIGHRQYQSWERDFSGMQPSSRIQIYLLCKMYAPKFADDWYEDGFERFLLPPVSPQGLEILGLMEPGHSYSYDQIVMAIAGWGRTHARAWNQLLAKGLIVHSMDDYMRGRETIRWYQARQELLLKDES